ncbi:MAG: GNAT family N-acetyltransferase [Actinomycetota bacterium]
MVTAPPLAAGGGVAHPDPVPEWDLLARDVGAPPFSRPGWVQAWAAMAGRRLEVLQTRRNGALTGILPMVSQIGGLAVAADWHVPVFQAVAREDADLRELTAAAITGRRRLTMDFCDASAPTAAAFRSALAERGFTARERIRMRSPFIDLGAGRSAYEAGLGARKLRELGRRRRRLEEEGTVVIEVADGSAGLDASLDEGFAVEGSGWKGSAGTAIGSAPATDRFYRQAGHWAAEAGILRLSFLRVAGIAIAFDLSMAAHGTEWLLKTGYSPAWSRYSPGSLLRSAAIERAFDQGLVAYEFAGGAEPWKLEWTTTCRDIVRIEGFAPGAIGGAFSIGSRVGRRLRTLGRAAPRRHGDPRTPVSG